MPCQVVNCIVISNFLIIIIKCDQLATCIYCADATKPGQRHLEGEELLSQRENEY